MSGTLPCNICMQTGRLAIHVCEADMLVNHQPDWTSRDWRSLYTSIFQKVWPVQHSVRIRQGRLVT